MESLDPSSSESMNLSKSASGVSAALVLSLSSMAAEPAGNLIAEGDVYAARFNSQESLKYYLPGGEAVEPGNIPLLVRISREYRHLMSDA